MHHYILHEDFRYEIAIKCLGQKRRQVQVFTFQEYFAVLIGS